MDSLLNLKAIANSLVFSLIGLVMFSIGFMIFDRATPGQFWKEIIEEHNTALAIIVGSVAIGISLIIAFAIHGG
jgi:putative membrane protein